MKLKILLLLMMCVVPCIMFGQSAVHRWHVVDNGGAKSSAGGVQLQASIGQPAVRAMTATATSLESGYIPGIRFLSGASSTLDLAVADGWNMISVPLLVSDFSKPALYPSAVSNAFSYQGSYVVRDTLQNGVGYWLKYPSASMTHAAGTSIARETINVADKWNMIGVPSYPVLLADIMPLSPTVIASSFFGYSGGYFAEDTLKPGKAYWIKVTNAGKLVLKTGSVSIEPLASSAAQGKSKKKYVPFGLPDNVEPNILTLTDAKGRTQTLYFLTTVNEIDLSKFELPPYPPDGIFDARYVTNRMMESADKLTEKEVALKISSAVFPLDIRWELADGFDAGASIVVDKKEVTMKGKGETRITESPSQIKLRLAPAMLHELPKEFALRQNFPNPFNPATTIRYDLPKDTRVRLKVYDLLGREVTTLADEIQEAGYKSIEWKANALASGVYFYRLEAGSFTDVKKLMLMK